MIISTAYCFAAVAILSGCDVRRQDAVDSMNNPTPANSYCLSALQDFSPRMSSEALWAHYRHFLVCDFDDKRSMPYLDELVRRRDPAALREKGVRLRETDPEAGLSLIQESARLGYAPAQRTLDSIRSAESE